MSDLPEGTKPFDRRELKKCALCEKGVGHNNGIQFFEVTIGTVILDLRNIQRIAGMEMFFGGGHQGAALADIMGASSNVGVRMPTSHLLVCDKCAFETETGRALMVLWEDAIENESPDDES